MQKLTISIAVLALALSTAIAVDQLTGNYFMKSKPGSALRFEISNVKLDHDVKSYGGADISIHAVVRETSARSSGTVMLLLKRRINFPKSGAVREAQDVVLVNDGTGLIDSQLYLTSDDARTIGADFSSAAVTWEPVGVMPLGAAKIEIK